MRSHGHAGNLYNSSHAYSGGEQRWRTNKGYAYHDRGYAECYNIRNELPYDVNWGRSNLNPLVDRLNGWHYRFLDGEQVPAVPYARAQATNHRPLAYDKVDMYGVEPTQCLK